MRETQIETLRRPAGEWAWWREDETVVVGWLSDDTGSEILAIMRDSRDAALLVDVLKRLDAR